MSACSHMFMFVALVLGTPSTLHKIIFSSTEDKKQWFEDLSKYVCEQKQAAIYVKSLQLKILCLFFIVVIAWLDAQGSRHPKPSYVVVQHEVQSRLQRIG